MLYMKKEVVDEKFDPSNYFLKILNMINGTKYIKKKVNHSRKKLLLKE